VMLTYSIKIWLHVGCVNLWQF